MKRILLSSAAIVAFAGAAAAEGHTGVTFSGDATLGYNDTVAPGFDLDGDSFDNEFGFYSELDVTIGFAAELDNGLTAAASIDFEKLANGGGNEGAEYELSLTSENAGLYYGDTSFAAENVWVAAGPMAHDNFSEADGEEVLRGEVSFGGIDAQISYGIFDDDLDQLSIGLGGDFGNFNVVVAYQEEASAAYTASRGVPADPALGEPVNGDFNGDDVFGISVGTSFGGADVRLAYAESAGDDSIGVSVAYPFGPVTVKAAYAMNSDQDDDWDLSATYKQDAISVTVATDENDSWKIEGSYDLGNGLMAYAGVADAGEDFYVAADYDLGSGASLLVSFAEDGDDDAEDEIGANDYQQGTTVELSFAF